MKKDIRLCISYSIPISVFSTFRKKKKKKGFVVALPFVKPAGMKSTDKYAQRIRNINKYRSLAGKYCTINITL